MPREDLELVRSCFEDWRGLAASADLERLQDHLDRYYERDVWVDFGTRTPDSIAGRGVHVMRRWAQYSFPGWREGQMQYEAIEFIDFGHAIVVPSRVRAEMFGREVETRFTYVYRVANGKIVSVTMHETLDEALVTGRNTALVQEIYEAFGRDDLDAALPHLAEDVIWENPDEFLTPRLKGRDAVRAYFEEVRAGSATVELVPTRYEAAGEQVAVELVMRIAVADAPATEQPLGALWTIEDGRATRFQAFLEPERAFGMLPR